MATKVSLEEIERLIGERYAGFKTVFDSRRNLIVWNDETVIILRRSGGEYNFTMLGNGFVVSRRSTGHIGFFKNGITVWF